MSNNQEKAPLCVVCKKNPCPKLRKGGGYRKTCGTKCGGEFAKRKGFGSPKYAHTGREMTHQEIQEAIDAADRKQFNLPAGWRSRG